MFGISLSLLLNFAQSWQGAEVGRGGLDEADGIAAAGSSREGEGCLGVHDAALDDVGLWVGLVVGRASISIDSSDVLLARGEEVKL